MNAKPSGSANTGTRKWVYHDPMVFVIPYVTPRPASSNVPTPDEDTCHETEDAPEDSAPVVIETPDNLSPKDATSTNNNETCEDYSTVNILPMSKKPSVTKKCSRDTVDEVDMLILDELKQWRGQACSQNINDPDRRFFVEPTSYDETAAAN